MMDRLLALLLVAQWLIAAAAVSPHDARRDFLMMLDPSMPARFSKHVQPNVHLQQQQHLRQQVQRYAPAAQHTGRRTRRSFSKGQRKVYNRRPGHGLSRSLRDTSAGRGSRADLDTREHSDPQIDLPPASCCHLEQQDVQLVVAFDCSKPGVHGLRQEEFSSRVSGAGLITAACQ